MRSESLLLPVVRVWCVCGMCVCVKGRGKVTDLYPPSEEGS